jgi:hypothetical protein
MTMYICKVVRHDGLMEREQVLFSLYEQALRRGVLGHACGLEGRQQRRAARAEVAARPKMPVTVKADGPGTVERYTGR